MTTALTTTPASLAIIETLPPDQNPALVYLAGLAVGSRRTMSHALNTIANLVIPGSDLATFP
jgi:hypothetical protein